MKSSGKVKTLYSRLLTAYGPQGWWPLLSSARLDRQGYHPNDYSLPDKPAGRFEVAVGAVLTQNTSWENAARAIQALKRNNLLSPGKLASVDMILLKEKIRSSGYYNQKAKKLKILAARFLAEGWGKAWRIPSREGLLSVWGIGEETADSILLFAFHQPFFVVDAYTRRLLIHLGWLDEKSNYRRIQEFFHRSLPRDYRLYNEFHALIVEHAKTYCVKTPRCRGCPVSGLCLNKA